jgi:glycine cleavage system aminomethyltransferase T
VSLAFLSPGAAALARSPMEPGTTASGATIEARDGWNVAVSFPNEVDRLASVGFADVSHLGKLEIQASADDLPGILGRRLELGTATRADGAWWCPYSRERAIVICPAADRAALLERLTGAAAGASGLASVIDVTTSWGALTILGPLARETFARFTAIDLRPQVTGPGDWRPGSVARTPGGILCEADDRYLMLFGSAFGQYMWTVVEDAARHLGGGPVGA